MNNDNLNQINEALKDCENSTSPRHSSVAYARLYANAFEWFQWAVDRIEALEREFAEEQERHIDTGVVASRLQAEHDAMREGMENIALMAATAAAHGEQLDMGLLVGELQRLASLQESKEGEE